MNTTDLKQILDALKDVSTTGKEAFIWWLWADRILGSVTIIVIALIIAYTIYRVVRSAQEFYIKMRIPEETRIERAYQAMLNLYLYHENEFPKGVVFNMYELLRKKCGEEQ